MISCYGNESEICKEEREIEREREERKRNER